MRRELEAQTKAALNPAFGHQRCGYHRCVLDWRTVPHDDLTSCEMSSLYSAAAFTFQALQEFVWA